MRLSSACSSTGKVYPGYCRSAPVRRRRRSRRLCSRHRRRGRLPSPAFVRAGRRSRSLWSRRCSCGDARTTRTAFGRDRVAPGLPRVIVLPGHSIACAGVRSVADHCAHTTRTRRGRQLRRMSRELLLVAKGLAHPHLPQGAPTSPALANWPPLGSTGGSSASPPRRGLAYSRYADDLALSSTRARSGDHARRLVGLVTEIATEEGFKVNWLKTSVRHADQRDWDR